MILENGKRYEGDLLVGADGIWSKVPSYIYVYLQNIVFVCSDPGLLTTYSKAWFANMPLTNWLSTFFHLAVSMLKKCYNLFSTMSSCKKNTHKHQVMGKYELTYSGNGQYGLWYQQQNKIRTNN